MLRRLFIASTVLALSATPTLAEETVRVRATVEKVDGSTMMVKARGGEDLKIVLADKPVFTAVIPASMADIKSGGYIGVTAMPQADGSLRAVEVHVFPEAMRGVAEGHRPWDLQPQSTMTNAAVENVVSGVDGETVTLKYKDGEKKITLTKQTAIVTYAPGNQAEVKPGTKIFIVAAQKQADGSLKTQRVSYGRDGLTPPM